MLKYRFLKPLALLNQITEGPWSFILSGGWLLNTLKAEKHLKDGVVREGGRVEKAKE